MPWYYACGTVRVVPCVWYRLCGCHSSTHNTTSTHVLLTREGWTALHYAALLGHTDAAAAIVACCGDELPTSDSAPSAIDLAALCGHSACMNAIAPPPPQGLCFPPT